MNKRLNRFILAGSLFVAVLSVGLLLKPGQAFAAKVQRLNGDVSIGCPSGCQAVTDNPTSYYQIESPNTGSPTDIRITVSYPCSSSMGFKLNALVGGGDPNFQDPSACASRSGGSVSVDFSMYTGANCKLDTNTGECYAIIYITAIGASSGHFAYRLDVNGNADIANAANTNPTSDPAGSDWPSGGSARQFGLFPQDVTFNFTTPCNIAKQFVYVAWSGVDYGSSYQPNSVSWQLTDNGAWVGSRSNGQLDGNDSSSSSVFSYGFWVYPNHTYSWSWSGINQGAGGNEVVFSVPFTQNSFDLGQNCNPSTSWQLSGKSTVSAPSIYPGQSVSFYHTVTNASSSSGNASYSWQVQASYGNGPGSYSSTGLPGDTTTGTVPPGDSWPNPVGSTVTPWPVTATNFGAIYCQRIIYTNANGLNQPPGGKHTADAEACVKLAKPTTPVLTCNSTYVPAPKTTVVPPPATDPAPTGGWSTDASKYKVGYADITISGTNASPSNFQSGTTYSLPGATAPVDHEPYTLSYSPTGNTVTISITYYEYAAGHVPDSHGNTIYYLAQMSPTQTTTLTCYAATCTLSVAGGLGPNGEIIAGQDVDVSGTIVNPSDPGHPEKIPLVPNLPNNNPLSLTFNGSQHDWGSPILVGGSSGSMDLGAFKVNPGPDPSTETITAYPDYYGTGPIGPSCSATFDVYAPFVLTPHAQVTLDPSTEAPTSVNNDTYVTDTGTKVSENVTSNIYEVTVGGAKIAKGSTSNGGPFAAGSTTCLYQSPSPYTVTGCGTTYNGVYAPSTPLQAGDTYCADITVPNGIDPADPTNVPYVGPSGNVVGGAPVTATSCPKVVNEPFFKVYNSSVSTGSEFPPSGGGSCTGGELAGWNNDTGTNPPTANFGAGTQLNALAALGITGFASGQNLPPTLNGAPANLSFANTGSGVTVDSSIDSPHLGGNFGSTPCLVGQTAPPNSVHPGGSTADIGLLNFIAGSGKHSYSYGTSTTPVNVTITGGNISANHDFSIFVNGNVYIKSGIKYNGDGTWSVGTIPSFFLEATGNIYIDPGVGELDGVYVARPDNAGSGGTIYTCGVNNGGGNFTFMAKDNLYNSCNRQLTVYGTFIANHVDLMRTLGSLRDETPLAATTKSQTQYDYPVRLAQYSCKVGNMSNPYQHSHWYEAVDSNGNSLTTKPPLATSNTDDQCPSPSLDGYDGYIFPPTDTTFTTKFLDASYFLLCEDIDHISGGGGDHYIVPIGYSSTAVSTCVNNGSGGTVLGYVKSGPVTDPSNPMVTLNEPLYENFDGSPHDVNPPYCFSNGCSGFHYLSITDNAEEEGVFGYPYTSAASGAQSYTVTVPVPSQQPNPPTCSHPGPHSSPRPTCAAEVFDFSPELYLSNPAVQPPNNGALQLQAVTSLPPVL